MSSLLLTVLSLVIFISQGGNSQTTTQQCGTVGHDLQTAQTRLTDLRFYLNTQNPAPCNGNVSTWEYCYYSPNVMATDEYQAPFGLYRLVGNTYQLVSEFLIDISSDQIGSDSFTCRTFSTPVTAIQVGDVIGTCVHDVIRGDSFRAQINLAGGSASGYTLLSADTSNSRCNNILSQVRVPGSVSTSDLSTRSSTILHLYANIEADVPTTTQLPPTTHIITTISSDAGTTLSATMEGTQSTAMIETTMPIVTTQATTISEITTKQLTTTATDLSTTEPGMITTVSANTQAGQQIVGAIAAGTVAGVFGLALLICCVLMAIYCLNKKMKQTAVQEIQLEENAAYGTKERSITTADNEAYGRGIDVHSRSGTHTEGISTEENLAYSVVTSNNDLRPTQAAADADTYDYVDPHVYEIL